jgi:hypothetical protein
MMVLPKRFFVSAAFVQIDATTSVTLLTNILRGKPLLTQKRSEKKNRELSFDAY